MTESVTRIHAARDLPNRKPSPSDPFDVGADRAYPRAGVRQQPNGRWLLTLWDAPDIRHELDEETSDCPDAFSAFGIGQLIINSHRRSGTRLDGRAAVA